MSERGIFILAIESSCDDTSVAILENKQVLSNITANQEIHKMYGGVVPELASRAHQQNIVPVVDAALKKANIQLNNINAIAYTRGPGLLGSLLVGSSFAKSLSLSLNIPLIEVNHMQAHVLAHMIEDGKKNVPKLPFLCLTVSGGHTQIVKVNSYKNMQILGSTLDDAAGEAFDKVAKILGLPYPGGPLIDKYAKEGNYKAYSFPIPKVDGFNFSFSGLKTAFLYFIRDAQKKDSGFIEKNLPDICASIQHTIVSYLIQNFEHCLLEQKATDIAIAGGVSANSYLRKKVIELGEKHKCKVFIPHFEYCTDNAAMIGITAYYKYCNNEFSDLSLPPTARYAF